MRAAGEGDDGKPEGHLEAAELWGNRGMGTAQGTHSRPHPLGFTPLVPFHLLMVPSHPIIVPPHLPVVSTSPHLLISP